MSIFRKGLGCIVALMLAACGSQDPLVTVNPGETEANVQLVVGETVTLNERVTVIRGFGFFEREEFIAATLTFPESASRGDVVTVTAQIELSRLGAVRAETRFAGQGIDLTPTFRAIALGLQGCGSIVTGYTYTTCQLTETFRVPQEAVPGSTYLFETKLVPVGINAFQLPPELEIAGSVQVNP